MRRITAVLVAGLLVVGALAALPAAAMAHAGSNAQPVLVQQDGNETVTNQSVNATAADVAPGERLAGVLGVQSAEVEGELETRAFDLAFERADDNASKAEVIAREAADTNERLAELRERREALAEARRNGSMTEGEYRARTAVLATRAETVRALADRSTDASEGLPEETLRANGVNVSAIRTLSADAADLGGGEVAAIARSIAGSPDGAVPDRAGGPDERGESAGNATGADGADTDDGAAAIERAESRVASAAERVETARERVDSTDADENATAALDRAESRLAAAEEALADARSASEAGDDERAVELAERAVEEAASAVDDAEAAIDAASPGADDRAGTPDGSEDGDTAGSDGDGTTSDGSDAGGSN